jgi:hypothetical protein
MNTPAKIAIDNIKEGFSDLLSFGFEKTQLESWINQACDPIVNYQPNLPLFLEIIDLINSTKKT